MKRLRTCFPLLVVILLVPAFAHAQRLGDAYFGLGTARVGSNGQQIDTFGNGTLFSTPEMSGVFGNFGGTIMLKPSFGVNANVAMRFKKADYAGLQYRPIFYDFNGVWLPFSSKRVVPEIQAGLGGVNLRFYFSDQFCSAFSGCSTSNTLLESSNHFQFHAGVGVRFYVTDSVYVRQQVDYHWVNNFFQFGSNSVPAYSMSVGYSFGK